MSEIQDLIATIEELRAEKYPDLPVALVRKIIEIEDAFSDDRAEALKRITQLVDQHLNEE